jgi:tetratricopeptide (TPR) repeat protein
VAEVDRARIPGGPGWHIDRDTLLPAIHDLDAFRAAHREDPAHEALVALWTGDPAAAEAKLLGLLEGHDSPRLRGLLADAWRDQGRTEAAVAAYESLVAQSAGTAREAVMCQHLGKALFAAGRHPEALAALQRALRLREEAGADESLVESSRAAVERVREELSSRPAAARRRT